jgi:D-alanyl-D-alanine dipeptidase
MAETTFTCLWELIMTRFESLPLRGLTINQPFLYIACTLLILLSAQLPAAGNPKSGAALPDGFVYVTDVVPDAVLDIRYYGTDNFVGERIDSYNAPQAILTAQAAQALSGSADILRRDGYVIKIFDAYRPKGAVAHFVRWARDLGDTRQKDIFYPGVDKARLFELGYIAERSGHSRGSTVDLTIVDALTGAEVDMGSGFDFFGPVSAADSTEISPLQRKNREILRRAMSLGGFKPIRSEWWHFTLKDEPYPETYFDFPVE